MIREWKKFSTNPPTKSDRYWCYIIEVNDLGISYYQDNFYYSLEEKSWSGGQVQYWTELLDEPTSYFRDKKLKRILK